MADVTGVDGSGTNASDPDSNDSDNAASLQQAFDEAIAGLVFQILQAPISDAVHAVDSDP
jgi:hypothetical protein